MNPFDSQGTSLIETDTSNVRDLAIRGAGVSLFSQAFVFVFQLAGTMVLARLIMPADFGVVTMVTTFAGVLTSLGLNGFTEAVIQRQNIDHYLASNLFWINVVTGICLSFGFACCGSALARLYHEPRVADVCVGISASIFLYSASVVHLALLKRAMRFSVLSMNDIIARFTCAVVAIGLGEAGWGYWALVAQAIVWPLAICIGAWHLCRWTPAFPRRVRGTTSMVRFAANVYAHFIVNYAGSNTDNLLVGWSFQAQALGFYKKAYDLFVLPANQLLSPVGAVAMSALSKFKHDPVQFRRHFLVAVSIFAFLGMGISADLTLVGRDAIRLLLGPQWDEAGRIFTLFGPGVGIMLLYGMHGWIHVSVGKAGNWFRWGVIELIVTVLLFIMCLHWGPVGIASAWTASFWLLFLPAFWYAGRPIRLGVGELLRTIWKYIVSALAAGVIVAATIPHITSIASLSGMFGLVWRIVIVSVLLGSLYTLLVILLHGGLEPIHRVARLVHDNLPNGRLSAKLRQVESAFSEDSEKSSIVADQNEAAGAKVSAQISGRIPPPRSRLGTNDY